MKIQLSILISLILILSACNNKKSIDLSAYQSDMSGIGNDFMSINKAKDIFIQYASDKDSVYADTAFAVFYAKLTEIEADLDRMASVEEGLSDYFAAVNGVPLEDFDSDKAIAVKEKLHSGNIVPFSEEGNISLKYDLMVFADKIRPLLSKGMQHFFDLWMTERQSPAVQDAAIMLPMNNFADYVVAWDIQVNQYKYKPLLHIKTPCAKKYLSVLMTGVDNTPWLNEDGMINQSYLEAYQYITDKYPNSATAGIMRSYLKILAQNEFKPNQESEEYAQSVLK